jgi:threonylcarbamoyladenosine tRNA methylthiotransferase MtaB
VERFLREGERIVEIPPHEASETFEAMRMDHSSRTRAFVKIEDGCDRRCAYCIIPTARGPVRSKPPADLREELAGLVESGYREVVLSGINLSSYGRDLGLRFLDALELASSVPGLERIRLGSLEPDLLTPDDILAMKGLSHLCPQFHLSLQSGSEGVLRRMGRRYTAAEFRALTGALREAFPGCALTTDIMVAFPGETEEEFAASERFAREIGFAKVHVFIYSPRPGTPAAAMEPVDAATASRRAKQMAAAGAETHDAYLRNILGQTQPVLFETKEEASGLWQGYTPSYVLVKAEGDKLHGRIMDVRLEEVCGEWVKGYVPIR